MVYSIPIFLAFSSMMPKAFGQQENPYLSSKEIQNMVDNETVAWKLQNYAISFSKISNYKATMITQALFIQRNKANRNMPEKLQADSILFHSFKRKNALDVILKASEKYKVVIILNTFFISLITIERYSLKPQD